MEKPIGDVCQQLRLCISSQTASSPTISKLEEIIENFLLLLGGMGTFEIVRRLVKVKTWIHAMRKKIKNLIASWKTSYQRPSVGKLFEEESEKN